MSRPRVAFVLSGGTSFDIDSHHFFPEAVKHISERGCDVLVIDKRQVGNRVYGQSRSAQSSGSGFTQTELSCRGIDHWLFGQHEPSDLGSLRILSSILERLCYAFKISRTFRQFQPQVIYCNSAVIGFLVFVLNPALRRIMVYHSMNAFRTPGYQMTASERIRRLLEDWIFLHFRSSLLEDEHTLDVMRALSETFRTRVKYIPVGVDVDFWTPGQMASSDDQMLTEKSVLVLFQGRIVPRKGVKVLIEAAKHLVEQGLDFVLMIAGPDSEVGVTTTAGTPYLESMKHLIEELGLTSYVKIYPGWLSENELLGLYRQCDVYVLPTIADLVPHTIRQAMAVGKPIVSTNIGGIPALVKNGYNGFLAEPGEAYDLALKLEILVRSRYARTLFGRRNRQIVESKYSNQAAITVLESALLGSHDGDRSAS